MAYATVGEFKEYAGNSTITDDSLIYALLNSATAMIDSYTRRTFEATEDSVRYVGDEFIDGRTLYIRPAGDICEITSIVNSDGQTIASSDYVTLPRNDTPFYALRLKLNTAARWAYTTTDNAVTITGRWAYSITPPVDIAHATIRLAVYLYRQKDSGVFDVVMLPGSGEMVVPQGMPVDVRMVLDQYRRLV
jgi:hypothetical protein